MSRERYSNRRLPKSALRASQLERWLGIPFNLLEQLLAYIVARPWQRLLSLLDTLSFSLEGTRFKTLVQHLLFPLSLLITLYVGFELAADGFGVTTLLSFSLILVTYGVIVAPLERLFPWSREWLDGGNDMSVDLMMYYSSAIWNGVAKFLVTAVALTQLIEWLEPLGHQYWPSFLPGWVQVFLFILLKDFLRYWFHRGLHEIPVLWRFHSVHHSVGRLYWLNGLRVHPGEIVLQALFYAIPVAILQPGEDIVLVSLFMALSIGVFQHANLDMKLGFWEYIFSIGDNHRYHHAPDKEVGNANYGGEFIVWDILFGTFYKPPGVTPSENIGLADAPNYPMTWAGLMIAPFLVDQTVFGEREPAKTDRA